MQGALLTGTLPVLVRSQDICCAPLHTREERKDPGKPSGLSCPRDITVLFFRFPLVHIVLASEINDGPGQMV